MNVQHHHDLSSILITPTSLSCVSLCKNFGLIINSDFHNIDIEECARFSLLSKIEKSLFSKFNSNKKSAAEFDSSRMSGNGFSSIHSYIPALSEKILQHLLTTDNSFEAPLHHYSQSVALCVANKYFPRPKNVSKKPKVCVLLTPMGGN